MNYLCKVDLKNKLKIIDSKNFKLEKEIQDLIENNLEELFNLRFVKSEFKINEFRIDTLCFDEESKSFVIIEYKKGSNYSVIDQGYSYLSSMINNKSDFILEYIENIEKPIKKNEIDWSQSRVIFISPSFNSYQKNSVNFKDVPFELWEISKFSNDIISLNQILSNSNESIKKLGDNKNSVIKDVSKEVEVYDEDYLLNKTEKNIREVYHEIKEKILLWENVQIKYNKSNIQICKNNKIKIYINIRKKYLNFDMLRRIDFSGNVGRKDISFTIKDPNNLFKLKINNFKEVYGCNVDENTDLEYLTLVLKQKFDS